MRTALFFILAVFLPVLAHAADPRNTASYFVLFDIEAHGPTALVDGYGAYVQVYNATDRQWIRYCENFDGSGTKGRPNPNRERFKLLPFGAKDDTAYHCRDFSLEDVAIGQPLIALGNKKFFAMKSSTWTEKDGGEILFQFAKKLPLIGSPTYKTIRIRATRGATGMKYVVETVIPRGAVISTHFFLFAVSGSGLGFPNGITALTINPTERTENNVDLDNLEGPIEIHGTGDSTPKT
jgi:hypothetical protein